jgi:hypothetical protein
MFGRRASEREIGQDARDAHLSTLLREWKGVEPPADFEAAVWRRIRTASALEPRGLSLIGFVRDWILPHPAWASVVAAAAAIVVGGWAGISTPMAREDRQDAEPLLHAQTLAGSYLAMASGGSR